MSRTVARMALAGVALIWVDIAAAQTTLPGAVPKPPSIGQNPLDPSPSAGGAVRPGETQGGILSLSAALSGDSKPIRVGLIWRVFEDRADGSKPVAVAKSSAATPSFTLPQGSYVVHASYGYASASRRVVVQAAPVAERLTISAGALKLSGAIGDMPIPAARINFSIFVPVGNNSEGRLVLNNVHPGEIVRLPEGTYHVVSTYGESNAIMRSDLRVDPGRVTEATLNHRAATLTLKLVAAMGGEAFAGTAFSVLTPGGDVIREAIGAFPTITLAEGEYTLIARHEGQVYTREFNVESGLDRDIEVVAQKTP